MTSLGARWSVVAACSLIGCAGPGPISTSADESADPATSESDAGSEGGSSESAGGSSESEDDPDDPDHPPHCFADFGEGSIPEEHDIDLLLVIDNSSAMADEQAKLVSALEHFVDQLDLLQNSDGLPLAPSVNIMITTSDVGHPLCDVVPGREPKQGAPQDVPCTERLDEFAEPELCESSCPSPVAPVDPFVHRSNPQGATTNVPGNDVVGALGCLVPVGTKGCEYGSPLEAMLRALDPAASWNQGDRPFLRPGAMLAIAIVSDGYDCSVAPGGHAYFTDPLLDQYWAIDPQSGNKAPSPAICWNAGMHCSEADLEGVYESCTPSESSVLTSVASYVEFLQGTGKDVVMLDLLGVPPGSAELIHRDWIEGLYPAGDLLPGDSGTAASKQFEFGIGPGCFGESELDMPTGHALPPGRIAEVCGQLDVDDQLRCCMESSCDADYSDAVDCLIGVMQSLVG